MDQFEDDLALLTRASGRPESHCETVRDRLERLIASRPSAGGEVGLNAAAEELIRRLTAMLAAPRLASAVGADADEVQRILDRPVTEGDPLLPEREMLDRFRARC